jgi:protein involved in polysaccharide export with SLBB domain
LAEGDVIDTKFFYAPELNESQAIRPDGKISLQLVGEVEAAGKTPTELRETLFKLYEPRLRNPDVSVVVRSLYDRRVYVGGEVLRPGVISMPGRLTVLSAIMEAGGVRYPQAATENVVVIRYREGERISYAFNLKRALKGDPSPSFYLEPQDIVYVPQTVITRLDDWVDQHITRLMPQTGFFFSKRTGDTTVGVGTYGR